jgi:hypothetical protein
MEAWFTFKSPFSTVRLGKLFKIAQTVFFCSIVGRSPSGCPAGQLAVEHALDFTRAVDIWVLGGIALKRTASRAERR